MTLLLLTRDLAKKIKRFSIGYLFVSFLVFKFKCLVFCDRLDYRDICIYFTTSAFNPMAWKRPIQSSTLCVIKYRSSASVGRVGFLCIML